MGFVWHGGCGHWYVGGAAANADTVYFDNFNRANLNGGTHSYIEGNGTIVNNELSFTATKSGGDVFTTALFDLVVGQRYSLTFDYRGTNDSSTDFGGGFLGVADGFPGNHYWVAGTQASALGGHPTPSPIISNVTTQLLLDGFDLSYEVLFTADVDKLRLMFEDFAGGANNAFFDDVRLSSVPLPAAAWGGIALFGVLGGVKLRRSRQSALA